jgi:hypothetical protein
MSHEVEGTGAGVRGIGAEIAKAVGDGADGKIHVKDIAAKVGAPSSSAKAQGDGST